MFWDGWKRVFSNCFLRSWALLKTLFIVLSAKHGSCSKEAVDWQKTNLWKIGVVFEHGKKVFLVFFEVLMVLWFNVFVFGKVAKVLKMLVFPALGALRVAYSLFYLGLEGFRCFCVSRFCFSFCLRFVFVYFALFLFCCWSVWGVVLVFVLGVSVFCCIVFVRSCFVLFVCVWGFCVILLCFLVCFLFCSWCLLEGSKCCSSFVLLWVCFVLC